MIPKMPHVWGLNMSTIVLVHCWWSIGWNRKLPPGFAWKKRWAHPKISRVNLVTPSDSRALL